MQDEIQNAAYTTQKAIEKKEQIVVGVNQFQVQEDLSLERLKVDPTIEMAQKAGLKSLREKRDPETTRQLIESLKNIATGKENLMPVLIECVEHDLSLGEICNALRSVWGEYVAEGF